MIKIVKEPRKSLSANVADRLGVFDKSLRNPHNKDIVAKNGESFVIHYPYGIATVVPTREAVSRFIDLAQQYGLDANCDESIADCTANGNKVNEGGRVVWESQRYSSNVKNQVTLFEWLKNGEPTDTQSEIIQKVISSIEKERAKTEQILDKTGTNGN